MQISLYRMRGDSGYIRVSPTGLSRLDSSRPALHVCVYMYVCVCAHMHTFLLVTKEGVPDVWSCPNLM